MNQIRFNENNNVQSVFIKYKNLDYHIAVNNNTETLYDLVGGHDFDLKKEHKTEFHTVHGTQLFIHVYEFPNEYGNHDFGREILIKVINFDLIAEIEVFSK